MKKVNIMATYTTESLNGVYVNKVVSEKGTLYTKNQRTLADEARSLGTTAFAIVPEKHCFLLGSNRYYSKSILSKDTIISRFSNLFIEDCSKDGKTWVPCLFEMKESANIQRGTLPL